MKKTHELDSEFLLHFLFSYGNMIKLSVRHAPLAQLDRASGYGPEGQEFESLTACQKPRYRKVSGLLFFALTCLGA